MKDKIIPRAERRVPIILPSIILPPLASTSQPQRATQMFTGPPEVLIILSSNYSVIQLFCRASLKAVRVDRIMKDKIIPRAESRAPIILPSIILPPLASTSQPQRATQSFTGPPEVFIILSSNYSVELR